MYLPFIVLFPMWWSLPADPIYMVIKEKKITVEGNTSLGEFSCEYGIVGKRDTLYLETSGPEHLYEFEIKTEDFRCGNFLLNRDYQKTLKAKEHPTITVRVEHLTSMNSHSMQGMLTLTIAGKTQTMDQVPFKKSMLEGKESLQAAIELHLSTFELEPPTKLGGLIKTDDAMLVSVSLIINE